MYQWLKRMILGASQPDSPAGAAEAEMPPCAPAPAVPAAPGAAGAGTMAGPTYEQKQRIDTAYAEWLFGAWRDSQADTAAIEARVLDAINAIARSQHSGADLMRRMPGVVPQLLQSLRSETFSGADIARKISSDVVMVAEVIRLANSSALASGQPVTSVQNAVLVIGQEGLRQLVTSVAFRPIIDVNAGPHTRRIAPRIWDHSERCAHACRKLAPVFGVEPLDAFLAGLVSNAGLMVSLGMMDRTVKEGQRLGSAAFTARLTPAARLVASGIAREWRFPATVSQALSEQVAVRAGTAMSGMGSLLAQVDYLAKVKILAEHGKVAVRDDGLLDGLATAVQECYPYIVKTSSAYQ